MYNLLMANFAMHISLTADEAEIVRGLLAHKMVKKNTVLLEAGEICRAMYFVNSGCLRIFNRDKKGREHNISFCPQNWWAVDISSFFGHVPSFYTISSLEDSDLWYLSMEKLETLFIQVPKFERFFRILTQNGFALYQRRINSNLSKTAEERYLLFRRQYPGLEQRIAQKHIASYLGITPVFLSMMRKTMP